ncbi:MAG: MerR family transcriptional regulator [Hydrogeniiclostridium sp.]
MTYTIGEMARLLNIAPSALRYYDKEGLLPFVKRSSGGIRIFDQQDYEWLQIIECLKKTGMQLKDIRRYIQLAMQGDETIEARLDLFIKQREVVKKQMEDLQETLDTLNFKCWYYETAKEAGSTETPQNMPLEEIPEPYREIRRRMLQVPQFSEDC